MTSTMQGVLLPKGQTGSSYFHRILSETVAQYPQVFGSAGFPQSPARFKADYANALARFEVARLGAATRVEIARFIAARTQAGLRFAGPEGDPPLSQFLAQSVPTPELREERFGEPTGLELEVPFDGRTYRGTEIASLAEQLRDRYLLTDAAVTALRWVVDYTQQAGGKLDLSGMRFAMMGAGAELAPTALLQRARATVLWIDPVDPERALAGRVNLTGSVLVAPGARDLLMQPREVAATIARFASEGPVHIGMFAYAAGASQEWRLGASMNGIVRSLDPGLVASVSMFVSPTTVGRVYPAEARDANTRLKARPIWQKALHGMGGLKGPGQLGDGDEQVARAVVSVQGVSYQAAQYVSKLAAAETYAVYGTDITSETRRPVTVSSNVAGITRTRSLSHPIFQAAFVGAPAFGVQIFDPATTRAMSGLLVLHDLLNPQAPGAAARAAETPAQKVDALLSQQVHGGVYSLTATLDSAIRVAALVGMAKRPRVLFAR